MGSKGERFLESAVRTVDKYTDPANLRGAHDRYDRMKDKRRGAAKDAMREQVHAELNEEQGNPDVLTRPNDTIPNRDPYGYADMREEIYSELPERGTFLYGQNQAQPQSSGSSSFADIAQRMVAHERDANRAPELGSSLSGGVPTQQQGIQPTTPPITGTRDFSGRSGNPFAQAARDAGFSDFPASNNNRSLANALRNRGGNFGARRGF